MKVVSILVCLIFLSACSGGGSSTPSSNVAAATVDPIFGTWVYRVPGSSASQAAGVIAAIDDKGNFQSFNFKGFSDGNSATVYYRKTVGTYARTGNEFKMVYSYETCNPVHTQTLIINPTGDKLAVDIIGQNTQLLLSRAVESDSGLSSMAMVEDVQCNKF